MDESIVSEYYEVLNRIRLAISERDNDQLEDQMSSVVDGIPIRKLFVCHLASRTSYKNLIACFSSYGTVESCFLRRNLGKSNCAFVTFSKVEEAMRARREGGMKNIILHNRSLRVMAAYSWHQPDSPENQYRSERNNFHEHFVRNENTEDYTTINDTINILNDTCLLYIFHYLPIADRIRIERVCKRWQVISRKTWQTMHSLDLTAKTWGFCSFRKREGLINDCALRNVLLRCGTYLKHIDFTLSHFLSYNALSLIAKMCKNIQTLELTALPVSGSGLVSLAENCKDIRKLRLGRTNRKYDKELAKLFTENKNIQHFELYRNYTSGSCLLSLQGDCLEELVLLKCTAMHSCNLANAFPKFKNLTTLTFATCYGIDATVMEAIGTYCKDLKTFKCIAAYDFVSDADIFHIIKLVKLENLHIENLSTVKDDFLISLASNCNQLMQIDITGSKHVTDIGIAALSTLPRLQYLNVSCLKEITGEGLQGMCNLQRIVCRDCQCLRDDGITSVIKFSPNLEFLDLSGCYGITNSAMEIAAEFVNKRTNNTILKIYVGGTKVKREKMVHISPFLQIVNVKLSSNLIV